MKAWRRTTGPEESNIYHLTINVVSPLSNGGGGVASRPSLETCHARPWTPIHNTACCMYSWKQGILSRRALLLLLHHRSESKIYMRLVSFKSAGRLVLYVDAIGRTKLAPVGDQETIRWSLIPRSPIFQPPWRLPSDLAVVLYYAKLRSFISLLPSSRVHLQDPNSF